MDQARMNIILEGAVEAFWEAVAAECPEIKTGDMDPGASIAFDLAAEKAIRHWYNTNRA